MLKRKTMAAVDSTILLAREFIRAAKVYQDVLTILGVLYAGKIAIKSGSLLYSALRTFVAPRILPSFDFVKRFGSWAVITGCTDGIGKIYALELAKKKMNIVLISRNIDKLNDVAHQIETGNGVKTLIIQADFRDGRKVFAEIGRKIKDLDIGILVNNVGIMNEYPMLFHELSEDAVWDLINVNIAATSVVSHIILPGMVERKRGAIINLSSTAGIYPLPMFSMYSSSKAFGKFFSDIMNHEYKRKGIVVQTLVPFYVSTSLVKFSNELQHSNFMVPDAERYVKSALTTLCYSDETTGFWLFGIYNFVCSSLPQRIVSNLSVLLHLVLSRNHRPNSSKKEK